MTAPTQKFPCLDKRNERRNCATVGEGGAQWKMAAASLHNGVLLDSEECYKSEADFA